MSAPHPLFVAARARLEAQVAAREAVLLELDTAALRRLAPEELVEGDGLTRRSLARRRGTVGAVLAACVEAVGPRGVRHELGL